MKTFHRLFSLIAFFVLLYLGTTGSLMQAIDLVTVYSGAPESNPTMMSINEGIYGHPDYAVVTAADYTAAALPANLDYSRAFATVLSGAHKLAMDQLPNFVELRNINGAVTGQLRYGTTIKAIDATTGAAVPAINVKPMYPGDSLRQSLKHWHRFWWRHDKPGVFVELFAGLVLWSMIISGLFQYFTMLKARRSLGKTQLIWSSGGVWRTLHRSIATLAAIFLIVIAYSGTQLGFESTWAGLAPRYPALPVVGLSDADVQQMAAATITSLRAADPQTVVKVLRLRVYGGMRQGVVVAPGDLVTQQLVFNTQTGQPAGLDAPGYPPTGFPFGVGMHEWIKHVHSGWVFGHYAEFARWFYLFGGLSLVYLSSSGLWMYFDLWRKRRRTGRGGFFWI